MKTQSGNALFLILIAVALFAALSYAVTQSGRGGSGIDREQAEILSAELIQYANSFSVAAQRMQLINGCSDTDFSFWNDSDGDGSEDGDDDYFNPISPSDRSCHFFDVNGGGVTEQPLTGYPNSGAASIFPNNTCVSGVATGALGVACQSDGTGSTDLLYGIRGVDLALCMAINRNLGISGIPVDAGLPFAVIASDQFEGVYEEFYSINHLATLDAIPFTGCVDSSVSAGTYAFYHVIVPR